MTKHVVHYPEGHDRAGDIVAVHHEYYEDGEPAEPPTPALPDGTPLDVLPVADGEVPDPPDLDLSALKVDVDVPEVAEVST